MKGLIILCISLLFVGATDRLHIPRAPADWNNYYTCDFVSNKTGLRILIYYQGNPCSETIDWVGYRQQNNGDWEGNSPKDWGDLDLSQFICCYPI